MRPEQEHRCPKCKAAKGKPCTYIADRDIKEYATGKVLGHIRKGDPTKKSHNERLAIVLLINYRKRQARTWPPVQPMSPAVAAYWAADRTEYHQMQNWLLANASLFRKKD